MFGCGELLGLVQDEMPGEGHAAAGAGRVGFQLAESVEDAYAGGAEVGGAALEREVLRQRGVDERHHDDRDTEPEERLNAGVAPVTVAKAYRLLKTILTTAVDDGAIRRNPCRIKGAGMESSPERPVLTVEQVYAVATVIGPRYRAMVLLATFASLRWGELAALRRCDLDLDEGTVRVEQTLTELGDGSMHVGPPKSNAGKRTVTLPDMLLPELHHHLDEFAQAGSKGLVFTAPRGGLLRHSNFRRTWKKALAAAEVPDVHFHDLRHTGNTFTADTGATLRDLMDRMGHSSTRAALVYLHSNTDRHKQIADALDAQVPKELKSSQQENGRGQSAKQSGTQRARRRKR